MARRGTGRRRPPQRRDQRPALEAPVRVRARGSWPARGVERRPGGYRRRHGTRVHRRRAESSRRLSLTRRGGAYGAAAGVADGRGDPRAPADRPPSTRRDRGAGRSGHERAGATARHRRGSASHVGPHRRRAGLVPDDGAGDPRGHWRDPLRHGPRAVHGLRERRDSAAGARERPRQGDCHPVWRSAPHARISFACCLPRA